MSKTKWTELEPKLNPSVLEVIHNFGFTKMTPVQVRCKCCALTISHSQFLHLPLQAATIPLLMSSKDVAAEAVTGSGKTLAFLIPMLELLLRHHLEWPWKPTEVGAIIVSPTRELAAQTSQVLSHFLKHPQLPFTQRLLVGGNSVDEDVAALQSGGATILICTPGRLVDLLERRGSQVNLSARVKSLVSTSTTHQYPTHIFILHCVHRIS